MTVPLYTVKTDYMRVYAMFETLFCVSVALLACGVVLLVSYARDRSVKALHRAMQRTESVTRRAVSQAVRA